jgi:hypothetical protein
MNQIITFGGMFLTWALTELMKKNPKFAAHAPAIVTILSAVVSAFQAAVGAVTAHAAGIDSTMVGHATPVGTTMLNYFMGNASGAVLLDNLFTKWIGDYLMKHVFGKLFK